MPKKPKSNKFSFKEAVYLNFRGYSLWYKRYPRLIFSSAVCAIVESLTPYVGIYLSAQLINEIAGDRDATTLTKLVLWVLISTVAITLLRAVLSRWRNYEHSGQWHKRNKFYTEKLLSMDFCDIESPRTHDLIAQIKQNEKFGWGLVLLMGKFDSLIRSITTILGAIALSFSLFTLDVPESSGWVTILNNPLFVIPIVAIMLGVTVIVPMLSNKANSYWANFSEDVKLCTKYESVFGKTAQNCERSLDIRMYRQDIISEKYMRESLELADHAKIPLAPMRLLNSASTAVSHVFTFVIFIFVCLKSRGGAFDVGSVTQYIGSVTAMSVGVSGLLRLYGDMRNNVPFLKTFFEFLDIPNNMQRGDLEPKEQSDGTYEIEFHNVSFKYPSSNEYALKNISLKFNTGERLAVVGENGSGKTTFIKLLCRLYDPTEGEIYLNGINICKYDYQKYMDLFSVVFQDFKLLSFALGQNVSTSAYFDSDKVKDCLDKVGFGERLLTLPKGVDTCLHKDLDDEGVEISGGEAQKIALARALYKDSPFLILDEPTAALDPIAEFEIYSKMNEIVGDKSVVFISHRLSSCRFCNDIVVFNKGQLVQRGSHNNLVADKCGKYFELWNAQAQYYIKNE